MQAKEKRGAINAKMITVVQNGSKREKLGIFQCENIKTTLAVQNICQKIETTLPMPHVSGMKVRMKQQTRK